ncbi:hypothetical protein [Agarilytica rhodophyticola]|uniref:hypothetical protein n=1 Tax=Agarilytica rhodophyticola TaxID=1737490 RepID=UPI000B3486C0|nr:hypothetical protein [Agarilytica rhodophyticola]
MKLSKLTLTTFFLLGIFSINTYAVDRYTYTAFKHQRGTSVNIPESVVTNLCADSDGCKIRISMYDWDGLRRTASRETLFFYNEDNGNWRDSSGDTQGTSGNGGTQHIEQAWACYFTDGNYSAWTNLGDTNSSFSLLSWNQYNADCSVTFID